MRSRDRRRLILWVAVTAAIMAYSVVSCIDQRAAEATADRDGTAVALQKSIDRANGK